MTKKFYSITALKGVCCFSVLMTHWYGVFDVTGSVKLDRVLGLFPLRMLRLGIQGVYIFIILSAMLTAMKVYRSEKINYPDEILKRYINLLVPILCVDLFVYLGLHLGIFTVNSYGQRFGVDFAALYYPGPIPLGTVLSEVFFGTILFGKSVVYGPFWMMNYIFVGGIAILVLLPLLKKAKLPVRVLVLFLCFAVLSARVSLFLCSLLGVVLALWYQKLPDKVGLPMGIAGAGILLSGMLLCEKAWKIAAFFEAKGYEGCASRPEWVLIMNAPILIVGFEYFWRGLIEGIPHFAYVGAFLVNLGDRSMGVFCTHWLVIATFSTSFYIRFFDRAPKLRLTLNLVLTTILIYLVSDLFYRFVQGKLGGACTAYARRLTLKK